VGALNNLEPLKKEVLVNFSQFLDAAHISTLNCGENAGDRWAVCKEEVL